MQYQSDAEKKTDFLLDALDALDDAVIVLDDKGRYVASNSKHSRMFLNPGEKIEPGESAARVVRRLIDNRKIAGADQMDNDEAVLNCLIDCYSFVRGSEFLLTDGTVIQVSSAPTSMGGIVMTFRDTGRDRIGERRALELLSDSFGSVDMGMILWDAALNVQMCNAAWQRLAVPTEIGGDVRSMMERMLQDGELLSRGVVSKDVLDSEIAEIHRQSMQFTYLQSGGQVSQIKTFAVASGGVLATAIDISEQRSAEERARALLRDAVEALDLGIMHFDTEQNLMMMNRAADQIAFEDLDAPEIGTGLPDIIHQFIANGKIVCPDEKSRDDCISQFLASVQRFGEKFRPGWSSGRVLEFCSYPTEMGGILISVQDLTETVRANQEAKEANALVKTIVESSPTTFLVSKVDTGEIVFSTEASRERFGQITSTLSFFLEPKDREDYLNALLPTGRLIDYPARFRRTDGSIMDGLTSSRVIEYKGEKMIVSSTRDVTEYLEMQAELAAQREATAQNEKLSALGELLAGVAHELSNPMSVVLGYSHMLKEQVTDPSAARRIDRITKAADRCAKIVRMFLSMARRRPMNMQPCDLGALVHDALEVNSTALRSNGARIQVQADEGLLFIQADEDQVIQVLINLLMNARHAVEHKGTEGVITIGVSASPDGSSVLLEVADNGDGVSEDIRHRIFEPFFTTKDVGVGTGVGLAFCHRTIAAHGGELTLEDAPTGGALFQARFPVNPLPLETTASSLSNKASALNGKSVLVLDDEPYVGDVIRETLEEDGFSVEVFDKGEDALGRCATRKFDAIVCDIRMPGMTGIEFFHRLSNGTNGCGDRVIFLTGDAMSADVEFFLAEVQRPYLEKPLTPDEIRQGIRNLIRSGET